MSNTVQGNMLFTLNIIKHIQIHSVKNMCRALHS